MEHAKERKMSLTSCPIVYFPLLFFSIYLYVRWNCRQTHTHTHTNSIERNAFQIWEPIKYIIIVFVCTRCAALAKNHTTQRQQQHIQYLMCIPTFERLSVVVGITSSLSLPGFFPRFFLELITLTVVIFMCTRTHTPDRTQKPHICKIIRFYSSRCFFITQCCFVVSLEIAGWNLLNKIQCILDKRMSIE